MASSIPPDAYVIIIGAMKSGTTFLFELLKQHPQICPSRTKEPEFFSGYPGPEVERYEALFDFDPKTHVRCLEASTGYTKHPSSSAKGVPKRMKEYGIEPLFIYSVRNPFERVESDFNFANLGYKPWAKDDILNSTSIQISKYFMQIREFLKYYPDKERYFIVDFEDIKNGPLKLAARIFEWMEVKRIEMKAPEPVGVTPSPSKIEEKLRRRFLKSPLPWRQILPSNLIEGVQKFLRKYGSSAKRKLTKDEKVKLRKLLKNDMRQFGESFNFPIEKWGFKRKPLSANELTKGPSLSKQKEEYQH